MRADPETPHDAPLTWPRARPHVLGTLAMSASKRPLVSLAMIAAVLLA